LSTATSIRQTAIFKASPHEVYEALIDSKKHSEFTGSEASISRAFGGRFSTWDGYAEGKNLEFVPDEKIVQTWRASDWPEGYYSKVTFMLALVASGTLLTFYQTDVPDEFKKEIARGWREYYRQPLKRYLEK